MKNLNVGDKVKIVSYNEYCLRNLRIGSPSMVMDMTKYCDRIATITEIFKDNTYRLDVDKGYWTWTDNMFEAEINLDTTLRDLKSYCTYSCISPCSEECPLYKYSKY